MTNLLAAVVAQSDPSLVNSANWALDTGQRMAMAAFGIVVVILFIGALLAKSAVTRMLSLGLAVIVAAIMVISWRALATGASNDVVNHMDGSMPAAVAEVAGPG